MKRNGTKESNRTQIPKWTTELQKHLNGPTYIQRKGRVGFGRAGQGGVWQDRSKVGVGWGRGRVV